MEVKEEVSICSTENLELPEIISSDNKSSKDWIKWAVIIQSILILIIFFILIRIDSKQSHIIELLEHQQEQFHNFTSYSDDTFYDAFKERFYDTFQGGYAKFTSYFKK